MRRDLTTGGYVRITTPTGVSDDVQRKRFLMIGGGNGASYFQPYAAAGHEVTIVTSGGRTGRRYHVVEQSRRSGNRHARRARLAKGRRA